ncbi:MAG: ATP-binding protein, partial [bacterium]
LEERAKRELQQSDRVRLFGKARQRREQAARLDRGERVFDHPEGRRPVSVPAADEYRASVDELIVRSPVTWDDIAGMAKTKELLKYSLGLLCARWPEPLRPLDADRVLLYGPPGTGKTLLAAASSSMLGATFFNVKCSNLMSKWFGESSKLIAALFARARSEADTGAALVFIDEVDALCRRREAAGETGAERRILSTLLAELDGLADKGHRTRVIIIAATNRPQDISAAVLERFDEHILVPLPDRQARQAILRIHIEPAGYTLADDVSYEQLARRTRNFSGRALRHLAKKAVKAMLRDANAAAPERVDAGDIADYTIATRPLTAADFEEALRHCRPSTADMRDYVRWREQVVGGDVA